MRIKIVDLFEDNYGHPDSTSLKLLCNVVALNSSGQVLANQPVSFTISNINGSSFLQLRLCYEIKWIK